jgi:hypothetical protein
MTTHSLKSLRDDFYKAWDEGKFYSKNYFDLHGVVFQQPGGILDGKKVWKWIEKHVKLAEKVNNYTPKEL